MLNISASRKRPSYKILPASERRSRSFETQDDTDRLEYDGEV